MTEPSIYPAHSDTHTRLAERLRDGLPGYLGIELVAVGTGYLCVEMVLGPQHMAANDYLHAGSIVTLAGIVAGIALSAWADERWS